MVTIDSGKVEASNKFREVPKSKWKSLVRIKRDFLSVQISYDCRCLIEFCEEAEEVYADLGYASSEEMIREGYELNPSQIELAVAWLKANGMEKAIGLDEIVALNDGPGKPKGAPGGNQYTIANVDNVNKSERLRGGNDTEYTLRRLKRDAPEMLEAIKRGELSVNAAAIKAGIRKKPTPEEQCVKAFRKCDNRLVPLKVIVESLESHEMSVVMDWIKEMIDGR